MSKPKYLRIDEIKLDLKNYRTIPQKNEVDAINSMIAIKPDRFYAIVESLISDGYLPTENLIILEENGFTVKEGNRRIAALKLIHGLHDKDKFSLPDSLKKQIDEIDDKWIEDNSQIPCAIYSTKEKDKVAKIVSLTHAKGEKASRDGWSSVARARQNRDEKNAKEYGLDILEKYLRYGKNLTGQQKERWSGDYNLTVLDEALRKVHARLGYKTIADLVKAYPKIKQVSDLENMISHIGLEQFGFKEMRATDTDFAANYNIPVLQTSDTSDTNGSMSTSSDNSDLSSQTGKATDSGSGKKPKSTNSTKAKPQAYAINDQRAVNQTLKKFNPRGNDRQKIASLRDELLKLKLKDNPIAFCFLLRSMFEISANIYSKENKIPGTKETKDAKKKQNTLKEQLNLVAKHLTENNTNKGMVTMLLGAKQELNRSTGLLSVVSMNLLIHHNSFSVAPHDICSVFNNIYPLLEAMN